MANYNFLGYVLPGFIGGAIGATAISLFSDPRVAEVELTPIGISQNSDIESLRREVESLRAEQQAFNLKLSSFSPIDVQREPVGGFVSKREFDELAKNLIANEGEHPAALQSQIKETLQEVREKEQAEKVIANRKDQVGAVASWLELNEAQQELYSETLVERDAAARDFSERWKAGAITLEEAGVIKRENQTRHFDNVAAILHGQQLETFNRYRAERENWGK